jgi:hypothetical protein
MHIEFGNGLAYVADIEIMGSIFLPSSSVQFMICGLWLKV